MNFQITIVSIIVMILLGFLLKKIDLLKSSDVETLNKIVINISLPCMVFSALYTADVSLLPKLSMMTVIFLTTSLIIGIITYLILKARGYSKKKIWSVVVVVVLANTGFLGYPINSGIFGAAGLIRAVFCDLSTDITFVALSFILILVFGGTIRNAFKKIITFVPLWGVILGILFNVLNIPITDVGTSVVNYLADATVPLIMIALGLSLNFNGLKNNLSDALFSSIIKLAIFPAIFLILIGLFHFTGLEFKVGIIEAAMPSAMLSLILAIEYDLEFNLTSDCIFSNTIFSLITLPIIISFLL